MPRIPDLQRPSIGVVADAGLFVRRERVEFLDPLYHAFAVDDVVVGAGEDTF